MPLGESRQFSLQIIFTPCPFNSAIIWDFLSNFVHMHLCGIHYQWLSSNCCKCNILGDTDAITWDNACGGPTGTTQIAWFMGPTWGPSGADRTQVGPILAPWTLLSGKHLAPQPAWTINPLWLVKREVVISSLISVSILPLWLLH